MPCPVCLTVAALVFLWRWFVRNRQAAAKAALYREMEHVEEERCLGIELE